MSPCQPSHASSFSMASTTTPPSVSIAKYSDLAGVVFGEGTRALKDNLKAAKCRFNPKLTINGAQTAGWIFPLARRAIVAAAIGLAETAEAAVAAEVAGAVATETDAAGSGGSDASAAVAVAVAVAEEAAVGPSAVPPLPTAVTFFTAPDSSFLLVGPTFPHKAALKAAGGEWVSGWLFPAGTAREAVEAVLAVPPNPGEPAVKLEGAEPGASKLAGRKRARGGKGGRARGMDE